VYILSRASLAFHLPHKPRKSSNSAQVVSPFQAILDYEMAHQIPPGWVNYSISKTSPNGYWHKLERGEIPMNHIFFNGFNQDLRDAQRWKDFYTASRAKAGLSTTTIPELPDIDGEWLFFEMMRASRNPDPWMLPALEKLKASGKYILAALSNTVIFPPDHEYSRSASQYVGDVRSIFDVFVSSAHVGLRKPDPRIYELALRELNNYALENAQKGKDLGWGEVVKPDEIVFLDDIGENLKAAKQAGFGTIKVHLGKAYDAVTALEKLTGMQLAGDHPKVAVLPTAKL
jgi:FMN phosphatase YigB (HAD superfamily)